jgi:hypothetical protein
MAVCLSVCCIATAVIVHFKVSARKRVYTYVRQINKAPPRLPQKSGVDTPCSENVRPHEACSVMLFS